MSRGKHEGNIEDIYIRTSKKVKSDEILSTSQCRDQDVYILPTGLVLAGDSVSSLTRGCC